MVGPTANFTPSSMRATRQSGQEFGVHPLGFEIRPEAAARNGAIGTSGQGDFRIGELGGDEI